MTVRIIYSISLITIMSLIGQECASCVKAAEADGGHGGGLAGRWWRGWAAVSFFFFFVKTICLITICFPACFDAVLGM
jgi:hypothetical protein